VDTSKKPIAGEMCEGITDHWGFAADDLCFKSIPALIETLLECRKYNCNLLLNVGPKGDGRLTVIETEMLKYIGSWIKTNEPIVYEAVPADIQADNADVFVNGEYYYAAIRKVPMSANVNVTRIEDNKVVKLYTDKTITEAVWLNDGQEVELTDGQTFDAKPFCYGTSGSVRVARFKLK
jgi:alpha-L-fucosidase